MNKKFFKSIEVKIAAFALLGLFLLVWGINFLKGIDLFKKSYELYVVFDQNMGLTPANSVVINGVSVGTIDAIDLMPSANNKVLMRLDIDNKVRIPLNSTVTIGSSGLFNAPQIEITYGDASSHYKEGDTLRGVLTEGLMSKIENITPKLDSLLNSLNASAVQLKNFLQPETIEDFKLIVKKLQLSASSLNEILADNKGKINSAVSGLTAFATTLKNNDVKINEIVQNLNTVSSQLADADIKKVVQNAGQTFAHLDTLLTNAQDGKGTVGQLLVNDSLYHNLQNSLNSLDKLLIDLQAHPSKYINVTVFGKKEKKK